MNQRNGRSLCDIDIKQLNMLPSIDTVNFLLEWNRMLTKAQGMLYSSHYLMLKCFKAKVQFHTINVGTTIFFQEVIHYMPKIMIL